MTRKYAFALMVTFLFFSCEKENPVAITDGSVYTELTARYDDATKKTYGTAYFWEGQKTGRRLIFNGGALLYFMDLPMDYRTSDFSYIKETDGYHSPVEFRFTDVNKKTFINSITLHTIGFPLTANLDTIDSSSPLTVAWFGNPLENGESAVLKIDAVSAKQDAVGSSTITFSTADFSSLAGLKNTTVKLSIERFKVLALSDDLGGGGLFTAQYIAQSRNVYLK